jgi:hypothetical protein
MTAFSPFVTGYSEEKLQEISGQRDPPGRFGIDSVKGSVSGRK